MMLKPLIAGSPREAGKCKERPPFAIQWLVLEEKKHSRSFVFARGARHRLRVPQIAVLVLPSNLYRNYSSHQTRSSRDVQSWVLCFFNSFCPAKKKKSAQSRSSSRTRTRGCSPPSLPQPGGTFSNLLSVTKFLNMSDPVPFVVTEPLSKVYYKGLPSQPHLIATTNPNPYEEPSGPETYSVLEELMRLGDHPLASVWDHDLCIRRRMLGSSCPSSVRARGLCKPPQCGPRERLSGSWRDVLDDTA